MASKIMSGLGGAASGAALGTAALPGIGTAIGAGLGGLAGLLSGGDDPQTKALMTSVTPEQLQLAQENAQKGLTQQQAFVNAIQAQNGIGNQGSVFNQLQGVANGTGPNPAQAALAQATGANVANTAATMAGARGAAGNVGLMARQVGQAGAGIQQNAAGQAATLQAQQSLNALGQMGGIAGQQVAEQQAGIQGYNQAAEQNQGTLMGGANAYNGAANGANQNQNVANGQNNAILGGLINGAGAAIGGLGGKTPGTPGGNTANPMAGAQSTVSATKQPMQPAMAQGGAVPGPASFVAKHLKAQHKAPGAKVNALVSPGEIYLPPSKVGSADPLTAGQKIPGKPKVGGAVNSYENDTVPKKLQRGGIVLPRSVTESADPHAAAAKFVSAILTKQGLPKKAK